MLQVIFYSSVDRIRQHITLGDSTLAEDDVFDRYGISPAAREKTNTLWLDPGGFAFTDTAPIKFRASGIEVAVRPEHLYFIHDISFRDIGDTGWIKAYIHNACIVLPAHIWGEIMTVARLLADTQEDGRVELLRRLA